MSMLILNESCVTVALHDHIVSCPIGGNGKFTGNVAKVCLRKPEEPSSSEGDNEMQCASISRCGKHFAMCYNKKLIIFETDGWTELTSCTIDRNAICVRFFPQNNLKLLLADKSGSVYFYSFATLPLTKIVLTVLAHNSMLTNALISDDEKFILTCDRDEKIRVTCFPNIYNIQCYCLGHTMFISTMSFFPTTPYGLVSASGDGTLQFWNYPLGKQVGCYKFPSELDGTVPIVIKVSCWKETESHFSVAALKYQTNDIDILNVTGDFNKGLEMHIKQTVSVTHQVLDIGSTASTWLSMIIKDGQLQIVGNDPIIASAIEEVCSYINLHCQEPLKNVKNGSDFIPLLFKRDIDNVQDYQHRKKQRLINQLSNVK